MKKIVRYCSGLWNWKRRQLIIKKLNQKLQSSVLMITVTREFYKNQIYSRISIPNPSLLMSMQNLDYNYKMNINHHQIMHITKLDESFFQIVHLNGHLRNKVASI